jgi:hypothetical protein
MNESIKPKVITGSGVFLPLVQEEIKPQIEILQKYLDEAVAYREKAGDAINREAENDADNRIIKYTKALAGLKTTAFVAAAQAEAIALAAVIGQGPKGAKREDTESPAEFITRMREKTKNPVG